MRHDKSSKKRIAAVELKPCHKFQLVRGSPFVYLQSVEEFLEPPPNTNPRSGGAGFEPGNSGLQMQRTDHLTTPPPKYQHSARNVK